MEFYVVERQGVYQQGIFGIFSTLELARNAVIKAKIMEKDDYHSFSIALYSLDVCVQIEEGLGSPEYLENRIETFSYC